MKLVVGVMKAMPVTVPGHVREGHPVRPYIRTDPRTKQPAILTGRQRLLIQQHYKLIQGMAAASVFGQMAKGRHIQFPDDAVLDATEAGIHQLLGMKLEGEWQGAIRKRVQGAVQDHIAFERTHGVTGSSYLLKQYYAANEEERQKLIRELPHAEPLDLAANVSVPSAEDVVAAKGREQILEEIEHKYFVNLGKVRELLAEGRAKKYGRAQLNVDRAIRIFEDRIGGSSWRDLDRAYGGGTRSVRLAYDRVATAMREVAKTEKRERTQHAALQAWAAGAVSKSMNLRLGDVQQERLRLAFARHVRAVSMGYPADFITENRHLLTELMLDADMA